MNRRTFFHSLLGLMAIPFVGLKKPSWKTPWALFPVGERVRIKLRPRPPHVEPTLSAIRRSRAKQIVFEGADKDTLAHALSSLFPPSEKFTANMLNAKRIVLDRDSDGDFGRACGYNWSLES